MPERVREAPNVTQIIGSSAMQRTEFRCQGAWVVAACVYGAPDQWTTPSRLRGRQRETRPRLGRWSCHETIGHPVRGLPLRTRRMSRNARISATTTPTAMAMVRQPQGWDCSAKVDPRSIPALAGVAVGTARTSSFVSGGGGRDPRGGAAGVFVGSLVGADVGRRVGVGVYGSSAVADGAATGEAGRVEPVPLPTCAQ